MHAEMMDKVREFARQELVDDQTQLDSFAEVPLPLYRRFHDLGLANWWLTGKDGEPGLGLADSVDVVSELAYGDAGAAFTLFISILGTSMVSLYGSDELRERYLDPMRAEGSFCATLGSEQDAGSELARTATTATVGADSVVITGEKFFSTNSGFADFLVVVARSTDTPPGHVAVLVPRDTPGVSIERRWEMNGLRSSGTYQVSLREVRVPAANVLRGPGLRMLEVGLNASRILIAATAVGIARRIRDLCMDYAKTKPLKGSTLLNNPVFAGKLGQMEMQIEVMRNQCRAAATEYDEIMAAPDPAAVFARRGTMKAAMTTKLFCGQAGWDIAGVGSEMFGGLGYTHDMAIGKLLRDMRYVAIVEGGDDVLRDVIFSRYVIPVSKRT
ncbi:acyl-CoA dehydrogenase family protein [Actinokineospora sp.]|uniref:acyl-CoA dehydrogenase family protein n=1 Tax=Actinokineospora sp. TaxID=1872133 RepID=UPI004037FF0B